MVDQVVHNARLSLANTVKKIASHTEEAFKVEHSSFDATEIPTYWAMGDAQRKSVLPHCVKTFSSIEMGMGEDPEELTLEMADAIACTAIETCRKNGFNDFAVSVVDAAGNLIVMKKMDGLKAIEVPGFATAKAYTCVAVGNSSRGFRDKYTDANDVKKYAQMLAMGDISGGKLAPFPGGVLIKNGCGKILGAVGVSGASADEDEYCALKGVWDTLPTCDTVPAEHCCETLKK